MLTKVAFGLAVALATVSSSFAAPHGYAAGSGQGFYSARGVHVGTDPDQGIRFELKRDADRANVN